MDWYPDGKTLALTTCSGERREYLETLFEFLLCENATMAVLECRDEAGTTTTRGWLWLVVYTPVSSILP